MKYTLLLIPVILLSVFSVGCKKKTTAAPNLVFKFQFDSTQVRLNDSGTVAVMPANHAGQSPQMNVMCAHYIEMTTGALVPLGGGLVVYQTPMSTAGGASAIDFSQETQTSNGGTFYQTALKNITPGTYQYLRVSLAYQNYTVQMYIDTTVNGYNLNQIFPSTIASFVGVNTYIKSYTIKDSVISVEGNRAQGYWGFETPVNLNIAGYSYKNDYVETGQAPAGATTVVNPLFASSPIPAGSCVVTAAFSGGPLIITGSETSDIVVNVSLSVNKSFEWVEVKKDGLWEPLIGENIVDMGIRGMIPTVQQ
jgi:hypothetical protein